MRRQRLHLVVLTAVILSAHCDRSPGVPPEQRVRTLTISPAAVALFSIGAQVRLAAAAMDAQGRSVAGVAARWTSDDTSVARVDSAGTVTAAGRGETVVRAVVGSAAAAAAVTVTQVPASVRVSWPTDTILHVFGPAAQATAVVADSNGNAIAGAPVSWSVSDTTIAVVDGAGRVSARRNGPVLLRAVSGGASGTLGLRVDVRGSLRVRVSTRGPGRPPAGYSLQLDSLAFALPADTTVVLGNLVEAIHPVSIAATGGLCMALGLDRAGPRVVPADTVEVDFSFRCAGRYSYAAWDDHAVHYVDEVGRDSRITPSYERLDAFEWAPDGSRLVYAATAAGQPQHLYSVRADGTGVTQLTNGATGEGQPRWSPDGTRILFVVPAQVGPGPTWWYTMAADGGDVQPLAFFPRVAFNATWSPDGRRVVVEVAGAYFIGLNLIDVQTGIVTQLDSTPMAHSGGWSPDGTSIAFHSGTSSGGLVGLYALADGAVTRYTVGSDPSALAWSPDGTKLLLSFNDVPWSVSALELAGGRLTRLSPADGAWYWAPSYSRDGRTILLLAAQGALDGIILMDEDGTHLQQLPHPGGYVSALAWRP